MPRLRGMPYLPGQARGLLRSHPAPDAADAILVLAPGNLPWQGGTVPRAIVVVEGAPFSHPVLRLRALGVPLVLIDHATAAKLPMGARVALDGASGFIDTDPIALAAPASEPAPAGVPLHTADGIAIELHASIGSAAGAREAVVRGAAAIGLLRSEYLCADARHPPDTASLQAALREVCTAARPLPVTLRLVDIAADKRPRWLGPSIDLTGPLGLQGARLYELEPVRSVLAAQLEAAAALANEHELRLLVPYLTRMEEWVRIRETIDARGADGLPVGAMIETPAAALDAGSWMDIADFIALGCNDLMQCLFAADRDQPALRPLLDPYSPVLHRFLRQIARDAGARAGEILVCGLLSQLPGTLPVLIGLGYRRFSVDPMVIPWLAQTVRGCSANEAKARAAAVCAARRSSEVRERLDVPAP